MCYIRHNYMFRPLMLAIFRLFMDLPNICGVFFWECDPAILVPHWGWCTSKKLFNISSGAPVKEPSLQDPSWSPLRESCPIPRALLCSSFKVPSIWDPLPPPDSRFPSDIKGPLWREMPISGAFLNVSSRVPSKGALPIGPPHWASSERNAPFLEPPHVSKSLVDEPPSRFPNGAPMERDAHLQSLFYLSSRIPSMGALPPGFLHRTLIEKNTPPPEPLSAISQSPW